MRVKTLWCTFLAISLTQGVSAENGKMQDELPNIGWQFYNLPKKAKPKKSELPQPQMLQAMPLSDLEQMKYLQKQLEETKATAIMKPTPENVARYKVYQDYFVEKSTQFSSAWEAMLLKFPQLDYNIKNSFYNATAPIKAVEERKAQSDAIQWVNQQYGVFFFYRGNEPLDNKLAEIVKSFGEQYGLSIIPISIDGKMASSYPQSKLDNGQAMAMGIKHFPALFLVNPKKNEYKPLAYGFITQDDLARRVLNVVTNFKPRI